MNALNEKYAGERFGLYIPLDTAWNVHSCAETVLYTDDPNDVLDYLETHPDMVENLRVIDYKGKVIKSYLPIKVYECATMPARAFQYKAHD